MDNSDTPKARRPLPTPGAPGNPSQRPSTPIQSQPSRAISPSQFYGSKAPPPLPSRPKNPGSSHTTYLPSNDNPPRYGSASPIPPDYREPELVVDDPIMDDEIPALIPGDSWGKENTDAWGRPVGNGWQGADWGNTDGWGQTVPSSYGSYINMRPESSVPIEGRSEYEESHWWHPEDRARFARPGSGMLPPVMAEELHDPHHSLFSVNIQTTPPVPPPAAPTTASLATTSPPLRSATPDPSASANLCATEEEARSAIPHPHAYYCPRENAWVLLIWKSSTAMPPLASSFSASLTTLPDPARRKLTTSCVSSGTDSPTVKGNETHHFHFYPRAVDGSKLSTPIRPDSWHAEEALKQKRRGQRLVDDIDRLKPDEIEECSFYCLVSSPIPGVLSRKYLDEFARDKRHNPSPGKLPEVTVSVAMETLLLAIENKIFKGNNRLIKINSNGFQAKLGWNSNIKRIFETLGFKESPDATLISPLTEGPEGIVARKKLLRSWVELSAWLADFRRQHSNVFRDYVGPKLCIQIDSAREMYQRAIGAHPEQIPRGELGETALSAVRSMHESWRGLGLTPTTFSANLLTFAYLAQCRCDPANTPRHFTYLSEIVNALSLAGSCPSQLQDLFVMEQSRNRFTLHEITGAAEALGFGHDGPLQVEYDDDVDDGFIESAWRDAVKRSWQEFNASETQRRANEALRVLAESRGSIKLRNLWDNSKNLMSPDKAYDTLEVPKDVDDYMLITIFNMRLEESISQMDKMREALGVIADVRDSERLRQFLQTGQDPGEITVPTRIDFPRGLNQLGNTCYLNSLLQYFYTIKDLREAVLPMSQMDLKALEDEKLSEEDIGKHRVGGRKVSRREIIRSRKFIHQLANLFSSMEVSTSAAVTPSIDLAKLALVTSRDEEEDDAVNSDTDKGGSESSNDTDATLVNGDPPRLSVVGSKPPSQSSSSKRSVLGKRSRDLERGTSAMDIDAQDVDGFVMISSPKRTSSPAPMERENQIKAKTPGPKDKDGDVAMKPPPPPPKERKVSSIDSGGMMFGKQHDVSECMDNCMFQIETAMLEIGSKGKSQYSVVKRLFYGKIRQRLTNANPASRASIHEKEDLFSHLPVNVTNDGVDIYDGLSGYFDDVVDYEGGKARMEVSLVDLPPLLQIQLQRVQFNRETLQPYKSQAYVKFGETIFLDRFMDSMDSRKKAKSRGIQRELNACRERIQLLLEGKNGSFASTLDHTASFLSSLHLSSTVPGIDPSLPLTLQSEKVALEAELDALRNRSDKLKDELEALWATSQEFPYELTSVFIHRGSSPTFGHYFFYSRNLPHKPDEWFKYNDSDVTLVNKDEVLQDTTGSTANPYTLVFARKGSNVIETVNRIDLAQ
ncbi:ubiquitin C-terminal hydrolase Ubp2 [Coprinopsis sp. MPI-PUGE-AT-0042]|nr:ubiquitin C-terminal hydrolase Ubp2 [Coprinopsis sp. MPI-PUGE-AT-0042]